MEYGIEESASSELASFKQADAWYRERENQVHLHLRHFYGLSFVVASKNTTAKNLCEKWARDFAIKLMLRGSEEIRIRWKNVYLHPGIRVLELEDIHDQDELEVKIQWL